MGDAIIVLNAGSSSLKFSIYGVGDAELVLQARGQVEGVGGTPHFSAMDGEGWVLADRVNSFSAEFRSAMHWSTRRRSTTWRRGHTIDLRR
jgi:acetate kinase